MENHQNKTNQSQSDAHCAYAKETIQRQQSQTIPSQPDEDLKKQVKSSLRTKQNAENFCLKRYIYIYILMIEI